MNKLCRGIFWQDFSGWALNCVYENRVRWYIIKFENCGKEHNMKKKGKIILAVALAVVPVLAVAIILLLRRCCKDCCDC